jgi:hypothetical protein
MGNYRAGTKRQTDANIKKMETIKANERNDKEQLRSGCRRIQVQGQFEKKSCESLSQIQNEK